jgi:hypothetical protein
MHCSHNIEFFYNLNARDQRRHTEAISVHFIPYRRCNELLDTGKAALYDENLHTTH